MDKYLPLKIKTYIVLMIGLYWLGIKEFSLMERNMIGISY
jgi:hypothetical protein